MYSVNYINRNVLITSTECAQKFGDAIAPNKWNSAIEIAEARFVVPLLGYDMYIDMCNSKNVTVTSGNISTLQAYFDAQYPPDGTITLQVGNIVNAVELATMSAAYQQLWNMYLYKYVYECVFFIALSSNYAQFTSQGILKSNPVGSVLGDNSTASVGIGLKDIKYLEDRCLLDRINPLQTVLEEWLCANKGSYTLYSNSNCNCLKSKRTTSFLLDIYDEEDNYYHRSWGNSNPITPTPTPAPLTSTCSIEITIKTTPDGTLFGLCNLQTIPAQYEPSATTLTLSNLIGKYVMMSGAMYNGSPANIASYNDGSHIGYDQATGTFDRTAQGGWIDGDVFSFLYTETMGA